MSTDDRLNQALDALHGPDAFRDRVFNAWQALITLPPSALPAAARHEFAALHEELSGCDLRELLTAMPDEEVGDLERQILAICVVTMAVQPAT
jgi:hypothetical protein